MFFFPVSQLLVSALPPSVWFHSSLSNVSKWSQIKSASFMRCHFLNYLPGWSVTSLLQLRGVSVYQQVFFNPASNQQSKIILGAGVIHHGSFWQGNPPVDSCEKQRVTVCQNHNKPLLRQSLTGFPSGSCGTSWDNETAAPQPTTCSLSFTWFITPSRLRHG